jgi:hypothetical protein
MFYVYLLESLSDLHGGLEARTPQSTMGLATNVMVGYAPSALTHPTGFITQ